ncbi:MAG: type I glyceraldehyde-3-phosphate dehydrogenase [Gammaproteobacteria bacterium]|nr:type I glyceraldehyde-3-phosphate dehydrogenase [Gammaproteobacteria bacterium]MDD9824211.1 type I glyceraldehyde-3-phosphate dehydrogenase [Gammaproteobacteria bacterium]MDD9863266.1 type I glyceraldehyde-3-phosphate dehydrogenase [Gammaproteobacteria bacterium]
MTIQVAINGYGRIGRCILRAHYERERPDEIRIVAVNDLGDAEINALLTRRDSTHGPFPGTVEVEKDAGAMRVNGDRIRILAERDPGRLPWGDLGVDVVFEATGLFANRAAAEAHLQAGAKKVLISAPAGKDVDATVVHGVNHDRLRASHTVVSNASCTTNCLAPVVKVLHEHIGVLQGLMTTVHSYTNDQVLTDTFHKDPRRARSAAQSIVLTGTGAARAVGLVLPELAGRLDGYAARVPTMNVSMVDLTFQAARETSVQEIDSLMREAANGPLDGVLEFCDEPLVSVDFNHNPASAIYDATMTRILGGGLVKVVAWYDNEWGFANRMLDVACAWARAPD